MPSYIDKNYVKAKISVESNWNPDAVSSVGAKGLMQIMEQTWSDYDSTNYEEKVFNPEKNILVGIKHLKKIDEYLQENFPGYFYLSEKEKQDILSAGYNTGTENLKRNKWEIGKLSKETRKHVGKMRKMLGG